MAFVKTLIYKKMTENADPGKAFAEINREIYSSNPEGMFVTVFAVIFDKNSNSFSYINADHNKPVIIRNGNAEQTAKGVCDGVYNTLTEFTKNAEQFDDITIVAIKNNKNTD